VKILTDVQDSHQPIITILESIFGHVLHFVAIKFVHYAVAICCNMSFRATSSIS
jgi:hypothetical protein